MDFTRVWVDFNDLEEIPNDGSLYAVGFPDKWAGVFLREQVIAYDHDGNTMIGRISGMMDNGFGPFVQVQFPPGTKLNHS